MNHTALPIGPNDIYNAKWMTIEEVADTFVAPPRFELAAKRRCSLLVGPRGSGKTTILRMLTEPAIDRTAEMAASTSRIAIDYTGVFIDTDVGWYGQLKALGRNELDDDTRRLLQSAAVTAHIQKKLVEAMAYRLSKLTEPKSNQLDSLESRIVNALAAFWHLTPAIPSFASVQSALRFRLQEVYEIAAAESRLSSDGRPQRLATYKYLNMPLLVSCRNAIEEFNSAVEQSGHFWALLFDEVELMPPHVRNALLQSLRALTGVILLKLALSPFDSDDLRPTGAQRGHDYDNISLWFPWKRASASFSESLWKILARNTAVAGTKPEHVLGRSLLDTRIRKKTAYTAESKHLEYFRKLNGNDSNFCDYLNDQGIDLSRPDIIGGKKRAATLRKVFPIVFARVERVKWNAEKRTELRSRKIAAGYTGVMPVFDICEGNPRLLKDMVGRFLDRLGSGNTSLDEDLQADEITQAVSRFRAFLRTVMLPQSLAQSFPRGLLSLLNKIGEAFQREILLGPFTADPIGSFIIDSRTKNEIIELLGHALNAGAIIYVPEKEGEEELLSLNQMRGKRFRLSYLFGARWGLPPRLGPGRSLRLLLEKDPGGPSLFDAEEQP